MSEPIQTYRKLSQAELDAVNRLKTMEEGDLRVLERIAENADVDPRAMALARTSLQQAYMWAVRAVTKTDRIAGPIEPTPPEPVD